MAGHGYLAIGLLALLPSVMLVAYVVLHPRMRKGMPRSDAIISGTCILSAFLFPFSVGFVGRHKRVNTLYYAQLALIPGYRPSWDYGFWIVQLHMFWIFVSFAVWHRSGIAGDVGKLTSVDADEDLYPTSRTKSARMTPSFMRAQLEGQAAEEQGEASQRKAALAPPRSTPLGPLRTPREEPQRLPRPTKAVQSEAARREFVFTEGRNRAVSPRLKR
mmetsp:Transcript_98288/g.184802  ORF Transcript_98288/g.184802 Transcript_98288/m.184802 type:complete len:217 (+) Transcript_98288:119-769(+)